MSRNTSPVPPPPQNVPLPPAQSSRSKAKNIPMGITAGAEDVKYQAKYKELKRKVKEIEAENDKLHFKVLQAKRNIQRMKVERAILYERLAAVPPSPELNERQSLPPINPAGNPHVPEHAQPPLNDPNFIRNRVPAPAPPPPLPAIRQNSGNGGERDRHLPPPMQLPPMQTAADAHGPPSPPLPHSHERSRSHSSSSRSRQNYHGPGYEHAPNLPPMHPFSPPLAERERGGERRRADLHDLAAAAPVHNHQRLGPGTYINREDEIMRDRERARDDVTLRELDRDRERDDWERARERERDMDYGDRERERERELARQQQHSPVTMHRRRPPMLEGPASASAASAAQKAAREREDQLAAAYSLSSLDRDRDSNTPGSSGSRGDGPSPPVYGAAPPGMNIHPMDYHRASTNGRDRKRNVEVDPEERDRDRGSSSRRYHRADSIEDVRMGP